MAIMVTGGAGFIGSCLVAMLNEMGRSDIIVVDNISTSEKWRHLTNKEYIEYIHKSELAGRLPSLSGKITHVLHMGACSSTTEKDFDYLYKNNFEFTKMLWEFCAAEKISYIYASSAATYGGGENGFDDSTDIGLLRPLNGYGYSKQLFDLWARKQSAAPSQHVGLKFFNVYGPNEDCKDDMASVIFKSYYQILETGKVKLFRSHRPDYADGGQLRDFVYVKDLCKVIRWLMEHPDISGLFNLGTGKARSFEDLVRAVYCAMDREPLIEFIDMPEHLRGKYQYYTQAEMASLRRVGYDEQFYSLEDGVKDYVQGYLIPGSVY